MLWNIEPPRGPSAMPVEVRSSEGLDLRVFLRRQSAQPLQRELAQQIQAEQRRLDRRLHPERVARQGKGSELAAGAEGQVHPDDAVVLAAREGAVSA